MFAQTVAAATGTESVLSKTVSLEATDVPLAAVLKEIAQQAGLNPVLGPVVSSYPYRVTVHLKEIPVVAAFAQVLRGTGLVATFDVGGVTITKSDAETPGEIVGRIIDANTKLPIRGAMVLLDAAKQGVMSDADGRFRIPNVAKGTHQIRARMLGYGKEAKSVTVTEGQATTVDIVLTSSVNTLDQVIVTGTVVATALKAVPNAITVITGKELEQRGITHIDQLFRGDVPGLWVQNKGSATLQPGQVSMASRGSTSLDNALSKAIKTYVDGIELADPSYLGLIDPRSIERIEILTGPQASTIYGSGAINGVMQVFTKRGSTNAPQIELGLQSGLIQNNFSSSLTPQHDYSGRISGNQGGVSYNAGGSWTYLGPWAPTVHTATLSGYGGMHVQQRMFTFDLNGRRVAATNHAEGGLGQYMTQEQDRGFFVFRPGSGLAPFQYRSNDQTLGAEVGATPFSWWSHRLTAGIDAAENSNYNLRPGFNFIYDTLVTFADQTASKTSLSYSTTARLPIGSFASAVLTGGVDGWHSLVNRVDTYATNITGYVNAARLGLTRTPTHNNGAFFQGQLGVMDALFVTYGIRGEWNPTYGKDANPNTTPRIGVALTHEFGSVTAKLRTSFGHATVPPPPQGFAGARFTDVFYPPEWLAAFGNAYFIEPNLRLLPVEQHGTESGVELYFGTHASLSATVYNQTVDNQTFQAFTDSVEAIVAPSAYAGQVLDYCQDQVAKSGTCYWRILQYANIGSLRNLGVEWQASVNAGPLTAKGTFSNNKSRVIGVTQRFRADFPEYVVGASFSNLPEHTYGLTLQYAVRKTSVTLDVQGQGEQILPSDYNCGYAANNCINRLFLLIRNVRLNVDRPLMSAGKRVQFVAPGYALADLNIQQRLTPWADGMIQLQNVSNTYPRADLGADLGTIGRQTKIGLRVRW